jgi:RNA polymerase sigma factor (sigma-70 family)
MTEPQFDELRRSAFAIAYRMLGSVSEAEDVVQEGFLRPHRARAGGERIASPGAYLSTVVSRLSLDQIRSAAVRRETYVGEWLPEPLVASADDDPAHKAEMADSLSLAFLVLLESLSPEQRAAFLLREVFDEPYDRIAEIIGTSAQNARQLATRARRRVQERRPGSRPRASSGRSSRPASSRPPRRATSKGWRSCWPTTWCSAPTAAAGHRPSHVRCTAAPGWRARSWRACAPSPASA